MVKLFTVHNFSPTCSENQLKLQSHLHKNTFYNMHSALRVNSPLFVARLGASTRSRHRKFTVTYSQDPRCACLIDNFPVKVSRLLLFATHPLPLESKKGGL